MDNEDESMIDLKSTVEEQSVDNTIMNALND
jgi:hypothetical protein